MNDNIIKEVQEFVKTKFETELSSNYTYHNYNHTQKVVDAAKLLADKSNLSDSDYEALIIAAYFHDLGFIVNPDDHETHSIELAKSFLASKHYIDKSQIDKITQCIDATRLGFKGDTLLGHLMHDADLSGLADPNYAELIENLRKEIKFRTAKKLSRNNWRKENISFLENHKYISPAAITLFRDRKLQNLKTLKAQKPKKSKSKKPKTSTISTSKSAQTQFKTALRNHIDLSSIADNKANIMISVNAIIITVALPLLINRIKSTPHLTIPTIILAIVCLISMIFATLSTRPIDMKGVTHKKDVVDNNSNLFFFGNYYNMNFNDYKSYIDYIVSDEKMLDASITRDLFYLGKSLGKKFSYLRWCYNFFMFGIAAAVISFLIISLI